MIEHRMPIPARAYNAAVGGHVCGPEDIDFGQKVVHLIKYDRAGNEVSFESQVTQANKIYVIHDDFTLSSNVTIPANCVLEFDGGSISNSIGNNYTIKGHFSIKDCYHQIFNNVSFVKDATYLGVDFIRPEWFGAKGDFNYTTNTGTDDSLAITTAIRQAVLAKVSKVKFSAYAYYIEDGINIEGGDIILEGVYAERREEFAFGQSQTYPEHPDISEYKGSTLVSTQAQSILNIIGLTTHPVEIINLGFRNLYTVNNNYTAIGINFRANFYGPNWPFIVHYCHFSGFDKAIYFKKVDFAYLVYKADIQHNAFVNNNWCVMFDDQYKDQYSPADPIHPENDLPTNTWNFTFSNNCAHRNSHSLYVSLMEGKTYINNNNFEGQETTNIDGTPITDLYKLHIMLGALAYLECKDNHFEGVQFTAIKILSWQSGARVFIENNMFVGNATGSEEVILAQRQNDPAAHLIIENCDQPIRVIKNLGIEFKKTIDVDVFVNTGIKCVLFYNDTVNIDHNEVSATDVQQFSVKDIGNPKRFYNNILHSVLTAKQLYAERWVNYNNDNNYIVIGIHSELPFKYEGSTVGVTDNLTNSINLLLASGYRYCVGIFNREKNASTSDKLLLNLGTTTYNYFASIFYSYIQSDTEIAFSKLINKMSKLPNTVATVSDLANITIGLQTGSRVFVANPGKEAIYNGSAWVDATGTPV